MRKSIVAAVIALAGLFLLSVSVASPAAAHNGTIISEN
jgi:hypothetical protein